MPMGWCAAALLCIAGASAAPLGRRARVHTGENMNGEYLLAQTPKGNLTWSTRFADYPGGVESFEFYSSKISSTYGEVFWTSLPQIPLPSDIVERFHGKGMAVVGFEVDQVRKTPEGDVSLPINLAYNHHYGATLLGRGSSMERVPYDPNDGGRTTLLSPEPGWDRIPVEHTPSVNQLPTSLWCGYSNGGEFRKSYHGLPPPFVQVIESPHAFDMTPMQIDTWNRDKMNLTGGPFVPGPYPQKRSVGDWPQGSDGAQKWPAGALAPFNGSDAVYSGLLECPLTTRIKKTLTGGGWNDSFRTTIEGGQQGPSCPETLDTAEACFAAAKEIGIGSSVRVTTSQGDSESLPKGCTVSVQGSVASVYFNTRGNSTASCGSGVDTIHGTEPSLVNVGLDLSVSAGATITLTGPADNNWFGVGFDTHVMTGAYAVVVDGRGQVTEHLLGHHAAGTVLTSSITVAKNSVENGRRTIVLKRPLNGITKQHHSFDATKLSLDFITAVGSTPTFGYHKSRTVGTLKLWPETPGPSKGGVQGYFRGNPADGISMRNNWAGEVGYSFTPQQQLTLTALGRAVSTKHATLKQDTMVTVWSAATKKKVTSTVVGPAAGPATLGFAYAELEVPVVLQAAQEYYITQTCTNGMPDEWTNSDANAGAADQQAATLGHGVYSTNGSPGIFPNQHGIGPQFAGVVTFKADVPPNLRPVPATACVCSVPAAEFGKGTGTITYVDPLGKATSTIGFPPRCEPYPRETVLRDQNPTCDIRTYVGGLSTCHHGWHLLDADQEVPWQDQPLEYYFKWRFYFQEYNPQRHVAASGWNTGIGGNTAEYDVPQCPAGTPVEKCTHTISGVVTPPTGNMHFVGAHYHCHAPTCIQMEIYNNITGELLCREAPYHGQGADVGGKDRFDEAGYIAQRVCLWGNESYGLEKPPKMGGVPLFITATTNSTYGHHGEMALPQMLVAYL